MEPHRGKQSADSSSAPHHPFDDQPPQHVVISPRSYRRKPARFLADIHEYEGWWADAVTRDGTHYRGYIRSVSIDARRLRLEGSIPAGTMDVDVREIDLVEVRYPPHRFVVDWEQ